MTLAEIKQAAREDIRNRIDAGDVVGGEILPRNPLRIEITGRNPSALEARIIYRDAAPYYFRFSPDQVYLP